MPTMTGMLGFARSTKPSGSIVNRVVIHTRRRYSAAMIPTALWNGREPTRRLPKVIRTDSRKPSTPRAPFRIRIEQAMHVDDEIAHMGVVNRLLRLGPPCRISGSVVRINANDVELFEILEFGLLHIGELATEDEMEQLLSAGTLIRHISAFR